MEQNICIGYGKANFDTSSVVLATFVVAPEFYRAFPSTKMPQRGRFQRFPVTQYEDVGGVLMLNTLGAENGAVLLMQSQHRFRGASSKDGAVFIQIRDTGPNYTVTAKLPTNRESLVGESFVMFQGRGDLLSLEELAELNIVPTKSWVDGFLNPEEVEQCFDIRELQPELSVKPRFEKVLTLSGKEVILTAQAPTRRVRVR